MPFLIKVVLFRIILLFGRLFTLFNLSNKELKANGYTLPLRDLILCILRIKSQLFYTIFIKLIPILSQKLKVHD
jgi:hypothetical protein